MTRLNEIDILVIVGGGTEKVLKTKSQPLTSVQFVPPLIPNTADPDFTLIRATVEAAIEASENAPDPEPVDEQPTDDGGTGEDPGTDPADPGTDPADPGTGTETPEEPVTVDEVCSYG